MPSRKRKPATLGVAVSDFFAKCIRQEVGEYFIPSATHGDSRVHWEVKSRHEYMSRFLDAEGADNSGFERTVLQRVRRISELWEPYVPDEDKARFLRSFRALWVDTICFNQSNFKERCKAMPSSMLNINPGHRCQDLLGEKSLPALDLNDDLAVALLGNYQESMGKCFPFVVPPR